MRLFALVIIMSVSLSMVVYAVPASAQTPLERVIEAAKKEGKVATYGDYSYDEAKEIQAAFNKRYPFIKFEHLSMGSSDVVTRVLMESKSGTAGADVALTGGPTFLPLVKEGFLRQVDWAALGVHPNTIDTSWGVTCATVTYVLAWNTKLVSRADAPKNWNDLLDPKWKGAIGLWVNPFPFGDLVPVMGEAHVADYLKKLMQNEPVIIRAGAEIPTRLAAGEVSVAVVIDQTIRRVVEKGGPIEWVWPDPIPVTRYDAAIVKLARNPNAATLYCVWLSSPEGAAAYEKATWRGNIFIPNAPISQKTKGKKYSFWPTEKAEGRAAAIKRFSPIIAP
jgi:iron(III) transport system substrate-binding protein